VPASAAAADARSRGSCADLSAGCICVIYPAGEGGAEEPSVRSANSRACARARCGSAQPPATAAASEEARASGVRAVSAGRTHAPGSLPSDGSAARASLAWRERGRAGAEHAPASESPLGRVARARRVCCDLRRAVCTAGLLADKCPGAAAAQSSLPPPGAAPQGPCAARRLRPAARLTGAAAACSRARQQG